MGTFNPSIVFPPPAYDGKFRFDVWEIQFDMYVKASKIADKDKVAVFLQHIGYDLLSKLVDWLDPVLPQSKTYEELTKLVKSQCSTSPNLFASRVKLFSERQAPGQSVQEYMAHMTQLFGRCKLRDMTAEDFGILAIIRGLDCDDMRQHLMNPEMKKVDDLRTKAIEFEQSRIAAKEVKSRADDSTSFGINSVGKDSKCGYCDGVHQRGREYCPAKDKICKNCGKQDHFASVCKSRKQNLVEGYDSEQENEQKLNGLYPKSVLTVTSSKQNDYIKPYKVQAKLNGVDVDFQHDSGAAVTVISKKVWHMIGKPKLHTTEMKLQSYNKMIPVIGNSKVIVQVGKQIKQLRVTVVQQGASLFGRDWMKAFQMDIHEHPDHQKKRKVGKCDIKKLNTVSIIHRDPSHKAKVVNQNHRMHDSMQGKEMEVSLKHPKQSDKRFLKFKTDTSCTKDTVTQKSKDTVIRKFKYDMMHKPGQGKLIQGYCKHNDRRPSSRDYEKSATVIKDYNYEKQEAYSCKGRVDPCNQNRMHVTKRESSLQKCYKCKSKKADEQSEDLSLGEGVIEKFE